MTESARKAAPQPASAGHTKLRRDAVLFLALVAAHEVCRRVLADGVVVSSLFAPSGIGAMATLLLGLCFVALRVTLFVGVPGWLAAQALLAVSRRCLYRG